MRLQLSSLTAVIALVVSTSGGAQDITKKPVTGADRKKTTAPANTTAPKSDEAPATSEPTSTSTTPLVTSPTTAQPAQGPVSKAQTQATTPQAPSTQPDTTAPDEPATPQAAASGQTGNTPGQAQTSPGQASEITPAETGTTPSGQAVPSAQAGGQVAAATAADVKAGISVFDQKGGVVGKIDSISGKNAVVSTGTVKASVPISSFAKNDKGLVIAMTKAEIDAAAKPASTKTTTTAKTTKKPK